MVVSKATAVWSGGGLKEGRGEFQAGSGAFQGAYTFASRFEGTGGTNPEELIAAAHAACYSMALSATLERDGIKPARVQTTASCTMDMVDGKPKITAMRLVVRATVPGADRERFLAAANGAKEGCPVSGALRGNVQIELEAHLEG